MIDNELHVQTKQRLKLDVDQEKEGVRTQGCVCGLWEGGGVLGFCLLDFFIGVFCKKKICGLLFFVDFWSINETENKKLPKP